jgi:glycosyltransferase involved in cell wall biosynthesis
MSKIHVLLANDHLGIGNSIHGVGRLFSLWAPRFDSGRFNITICILRPRDKLGERLEEEFRRMGVEIQFFERGKFDPFTLLDFLRVIREKKIDVMHLQAYGASTFGRLAGAIAGIPVIVHAHDDASYYPWYQRLADLILCKFTDKAIAVSESVKESCVRKRKISMDRMLVFHNGIPLEKFQVLGLEEIDQQRRCFNIDPNAKVIGTVGKLREEKGTKYLLEAARKVLQVLPNTIYLIVGDGPLRADLEKLVSHLKIEDRVVFAGFRHNMPAILSLFDIVVMPSLTEGSPLALLEAMAMGKPIIGTNVGGIGEILQDGKTGLLIPPKSSEVLADKIIYLLKNQKTAGEMGLRAKEESRKYDVNVYVRRLEELYSELVPKR